MHRFIRLWWSGLVLLTVLVTEACSAEPEPERYDFSLQTVGGPTGWPVWVEELSFNNAWGGPAGSLGGGFDTRPPTGGKTVIFGVPLSAPRTMQARWFSYRTQTFYEIDLELPDTDDLLHQWYREYPSSKYLHYLMAGFSGEGEVFVWWRVRCEACGKDRSQDFNAPIVDSIYGEEVSGDPNTFRSQTRQLVDEGVIPSPW